MKVEKNDSFMGNWKEMSEEERQRYLKKLEEAPMIKSTDFDRLIDSALDSGNKALFLTLVEQKRDLEAKEKEMRRLLGVLD